MGELEKLGLRPRGPQRLDHAEADPAAAVDRHAGGLVDDQDRRILVNDGEFSGFRSSWSRGSSSYGGNPDPIPDLEPIVRLDPAAVDPHFTAAQHPVDVALGHALEPRNQKIVDALAGVFFAHFRPGNPRLA